VDLAIAHLFRLRPVQSSASQNIFLSGRRLGHDSHRKRAHHKRRYRHTALVEELNELEYIKGEIYANVWHTDRIARISPRDGHVIGWIDLSGLLPSDQRENAEAVLNGIAYDAQKDRLFVTGKQWPKIFEIKIVNPK
jgi:glutaminyl-peptide cyclotransferase